MSNASDVPRPSDEPATPRPAGGDDAPLAPVDPARSGTRRIVPPLGALANAASSMPPPPAPTLASTLLEAELAPRTPAAALLRRGASSAALLAGIAAAGIAPGWPEAWLLAALLLAAGTAAALPWDYDRRATTVLALGAGAFAAGQAFRLLWGLAPPSDLLIGLGMTALAGALLHRSQHRESGLARGLAILGLTLVVAWLVTDRGLASAVILRDTVAGWTPAALRAALLVVAPLGLLVFMPATTTAGAEHWWAVMLAWLGLYQAAHLALELGPAPADLATAVSAAVLGASVLVVVAGSQRLAARCCRHRRRSLSSAPPPHPA